MLPMLIATTSPLWFYAIYLGLAYWGKQLADEDNLRLHPHEFCNSHTPKQIAATMHRILGGIKRQEYNRYKENIESFLQDIKEWAPLFSDKLIFPRKSGHFEEVVLA
jgi:hypothetical protein